MDRTFDILINNIPMRLLVAELDKKLPAKSGELFAELKPVLQDLFVRKNLREAVEFVTPERPLAVKVLSEKQFKAKRKSYNPKRDVYDVMDSITGDTPPTWWRREGTMLTSTLPKLAELFAQPITVRFRPAGTPDMGISEANEKDVAENIVLNFVGEPEEEEEAAPEREAPPEPVPEGPECDKILSDAGITSRRDFVRWALRNHPDKGGNTEVFQRISNCVDKSYPRGGVRKTRRKQKKRSTRKSGNIHPKRIFYSSTRRYYTQK